MVVKKKPSKGKTAETDEGFLSSETGTIIKKWGGRVPVCVVFPNSYYVGMSNLATHMLYRRLNDMDWVVCERCFIEPDGEPRSLESNRPLSAFEILFFTLSFELDFINIPKMLRTSGISLSRKDRRDEEPVIVAGGICVMSNPEPLHDFFDLFIMGDIETTIDRFMERYLSVRGKDRRDQLAGLGDFEWAYDPSKMEPLYNSDGTITGVSPPDFSVAIERHKRGGLGASAVIAERTEFSNMYLTEGTRGCPSRCSFCLLGNLYDFICDRIDPAATEARHMGILGGGVSFYPGIVNVVRVLKEAGKSVHLPSMRVDEIPLDLINLMKDEIKTLTFGIEAASERMRRSLGKPFTDEEIIEKIDAILDIKPFNLKLYFMIGLYGEDQSDIEGIGTLTKRIKHVMMQRGAPKGFVGSITVHVSPFVPKPFTPFQWLPMDEMARLKEKISYLRRAFGKIDNTYFTHESVKFSFLQGVFARGDRKVGDVILRLSAGDNLTRVIRESPVNLNFYVLRERGSGEVFPWDFIKGNIDKKGLRKRLQSALSMGGAGVTGSEY